MLIGKTIAVKLGEADLKFLLDSAINTVRRSGQAQAIADHYDIFLEGKISNSNQLVRGVCAEKIKRTLLSLSYFLKYTLPN